MFVINSVGTEYTDNNGVKSKITIMICQDVGNRTVFDGMLHILNINERCSLREFLHTSDKKMIQWEEEEYTMMYKSRRIGI